MFVVKKKFVTLQPVNKIGIKMNPYKILKMMTMKNMKLLLAAVIMLFTIGGVNAQPPVPGSNGSSPMTPQQSKQSINREAPIGTATLLMLGLGGAVLGLKIRKNNNSNEN